MNTRINKIKTYTLLLSLIVFVVSLTQTAITSLDFDGQKTHSSSLMLVMGGLAILGGGLWEWIVWLANPLYFIALVFFFKGKRKSIKVSVAATLLALSFMTWRKILASESGRTATIDRLNLGYWLWLLSIIILTIGIFYYFNQVDKSQRIDSK